MLKRTLLLSAAGGEGNGNAKGADQSDILALNEQLKADITKARSELSTAQTEVTRLTGENTQLKADKNRLETEKTEALKSASEATKKVESLTAENEKLQASQKEFDTKLTTELLKFGIRKDNLAQAKDEGRKLTMTEQCLAARAAGTK